MSLIKFHLKDEHIKLMRQLEWGFDVGLNSEGASPFGGDNLWDDIALIVYGKDDTDFDPLSETFIKYSDERFEEMNALYKELPTAIDVVMNRGSFEVGYYKTKFHDRNWLVDKKMIKNA